MSEKEKKYRKIGWVSAVSVQLLMLILFYFLIAWKEPFPPIPSYGVELSFGLEESGQGEEPVTSEETQETNQTEEVVEDESEPVEEETSTVEEVIDEAVEEEIVDNPPTEIPITETPSPDVVEEVSSENVPVEQVEEPIEEVKEETQEEVTSEDESLNPEASMSENNDAANTDSGTTETAGNEGKEEGTIDGRALMGEQGDADGASLQMSGWVWDVQPKPQDSSAEEGKIVYKIVIDQDGYIIGIELVSSTVSPVVERYYRQSVERLSFSKTSDYQSAPTSSGTITFIIKSK